MFRCRIDDTGVEFNSLSALARFLQCSVSWVSWRMKWRPDGKKHFMCREYGITILPPVQKERVYKYDPEYARNYYATHKEQARQWRIDNKERVKQHNEKWRRAHQEWYNAYYREQRRKKKEQQNENL